MSNAAEKKMIKDDIIIVLKVSDTTKPRSVSGMVDYRLFKGGNNLHIVMDPETCLWSLKFDSGIVPPEIKQQYTSYKKALQAVANYYAKRGVEIKEVQDV
jgi:hypothetical protein